MSAARSYGKLLTHVLALACVASAACEGTDANEGPSGSIVDDEAAADAADDDKPASALSDGAVPRSEAGAASRGVDAGGARGPNPNGGRADAGTSSTVDAGAPGAPSDGPVSASAEDDGADCEVGELPALNELATSTKLPDPFLTLAGRRIARKDEWRCRRQQIKRLAETFAYGAKPAKPTKVAGSVSNTSISVQVADNGKMAAFSASVALPSTGEPPYPAIVVYGGGGFGAPLDPAVIKSEGVAIINYDPYAVAKEGTPRSNKQGAFYDLAGSNSSTGLLVAWAWGVSRIIDVIESAGGTILRADAVGVTGCSRFGKGAFLAGVFDQRIALTMPIESGSAGVPIWRGIPGEGAQSLSSAYGEQPWLGDAFSAFTAKPTALPFDTHELVALVAPRGLFIMDNPHIANLGPRSAHVAALAGAEVYKALGAGDHITYYSDVQNGAHCAVRPEWSTPLRNNVQRFLKKTGDAPGVIKAAGKASGNLSDWREWDTPTLD